MCYTHTSLEESEVHRMNIVFGVLMVTIVLMFFISLLSSTQDRKTVTRVIDLLVAISCFSMIMILKTFW